jgi:hypothetical protein
LRSHGRQLEGRQDRRAADIFKKENKGDKDEKSQIVLLDRAFAYLAARMG